MTVASDRGLFLDLDGTLADSLGMLRGVYDRFLAENGGRGSDEEFASINGPPLREGIKILAANHNIASPLEELVGDYDRIIGEAYRDVKPADGAAALINAARRHNWIIGVVSSNSRQRVMGWLSANMLLDGVDVVVGGSDVEQGKPSPEPYLMALRKTGVKAKVSCAVEDSPMGVRAALSAGLKTFALDTGGPGANDWPAGANVIASLHDLIAGIEKS